MKISDLHDHVEPDGTLATFWDHYVEILSDPAHMAVEVTTEIGMNLLFVLAISPMIGWYARRAAHREHLAIDAEHGVVHHGAPAPAEDSLDVPDWVNS